MSGGSVTETVRVEGLDELREILLKTLPENLRGKALQATLAKAAAPIVKTARNLAPVKTGRLRRAIYSFRDRDSKRDYEARLISVRRGKKQQKTDRDAYYWKWVEFGRGEITAKNGKLLKIGTGTYTDINTRTERNAIFVKKVRAVPAQPFMRPAFESNKMRSLGIIQTELRGQIEKVARRAQARSATRLGRALRRSVTGL
jgi:HK97 gp10 family phage protein